MKWPSKVQLMWVSYFERMSLNGVQVICFFLGAPPHQSAAVLVYFICFLGGLVNFLFIIFDFLNILALFIWHSLYLYFMIFNSII